MGTNILRIDQWLGIIWAAIVISIPSGSTSATDFGFSGMHVQGINDSIAEALNLSNSEGVMVMDIALGGPADVATIKRGDLITHFDGVKIDTFNRLVERVKKTRSGQSILVKVKRKRQTLDLTLKLGSKPKAWSVAKREVLRFEALGLTLVSITPKIRKNFNVPWGTVGVLVTRVDPAFADRMLLRRGDVIVQVNQSEVWSPKQIKHQYDEAKAARRPQLLMLIERTEGFSFMMLPVK